MHGPSLDRCNGTTLRIALPARRYRVLFFQIFILVFFCCVIFTLVIFFFVLTAASVGFVALVFGRRDPRWRHALSCLHMGQGDS